MSGVEALGLVLGILPLLVSALEDYDNVLKAINKYRKISSKVRNLHSALNTEGVIFRAECVLVLAPNISQGEAERMLEDTSHSLWQDTALNERLNYSFGPLNNAIKEIMRNITASLNQIASKVKEFDTVTNDSSAISSQGSDSRWHTAVRAKIKFALSSHASITSDLDRLTKLNERFAALSSQVKRLERSWVSPSHVTQATKPGTQLNIEDFAQTRMASLDLYAIFRQSCPADHEHFLRLGVNDTGPVGGTAGNDLRTRFDLHYCDGNVLHDSSPLSSYAAINQSDETDTGRDYRLLIESTALSSAEISPGPNNNPTTKPKSQGQSRSAGKQRVMPDSHKGTTVQAQVGGLCSDLVLIESRLHRMGGTSNPFVLPSKGVFKHTIVSSHASLRPDRTTSLADLLCQIKQQGRHFEVPQHQRLSLAGRLGASVLQMYNTPWLAQKLDSREIYFFGGLGQVSSLTRFGYSDFQSDIMYIDVKLDTETAMSTEKASAPSSSSRTDLTTVRQQSRFGLQSGPPNDWLYHLGLLLIELAYHTPFTSLMTELEAEYEALSIPLSSNQRTAEFQIACHLADNVGSTLGAAYAGIIRRCLRCDFNPPAPTDDLDDRKLRQSVYENVVCKLHDLENGFRALQVD